MAKPLCAIVGMGPGIAFSAAKRFGREGYAIAMLARRAPALTEYGEQLRQLGVEAMGYPADAGQDRSLVTALEEVKQRQGNPAVLIYNAAVLRQEVATKTTPQEFQHDFRINVLGAAVATQQVVPAMRAARTGTILFTGGGLALQPLPKFASMAIGKAGIRSLCYSLAAELKPAGIHVATVTITGIVQPGTKFDPELIAEEFWKLHAQQPNSWQVETVLE